MMALSNIVTSSYSTENFSGVVVKGDFAEGILSAWMSTPADSVITSSDDLNGMFSLFLLSMFSGICNDLVHILRTNHLPHLHTIFSPHLVCYIPQPLYQVELKGVLF